MGEASLGDPISKQLSYRSVQDSSSRFGVAKAGKEGEPLPCVVYSKRQNKAVKVQSGAEHVAILTEKGDVLTFGK